MLATAPLNLRALVGNWHRCGIAEASQHRVPPSLPRRPLLLRPPPSPLDAGARPSGPPTPVPEVAGAAQSTTARARSGPPRRARATPPARTHGTPTTPRTHLNRPSLAALHRVHHAPVRGDKRAVPRPLPHPAPFAPVPPHSPSPLTSTPPGGRRRSPGASAAHGASRRAAVPKEVGDQSVAVPPPFLSSLLSLCFAMLHRHRTLTLAPFRSQERHQESPSTFGTRGGHRARRRRTTLPRDLQLSPRAPTTLRHRFQPSPPSTSTRR